MIYNQGLERGGYRVHWCECISHRGSIGWHRGCDSSGVATITTSNARYCRASRCSRCAGRSLAAISSNWVRDVVRVSPTAGAVWSNDVRGATRYSGWSGNVYISGLTSIGSGDTCGRWIFVRGRWSTTTSRWRIHRLVDSTRCLWTTTKHKQQQQQRQRHKDTSEKKKKWIHILHQMWTYSLRCCRN